MSRKQHLFNGRRVRVRDLLETGLLEPDARICFKRLQAGEIHHATVTRTGNIRFDDGREFRSLSRAASELTGTQIDGWLAWATTDDPSSPLDVLRQKLLEESVSEEVDSAEAAPGESGRSAKSIHEFLRDARQAAEAANPVKASVRTFISHWNARGRDSSINHDIDADLANYGLITRPDFRAVTLDDPVALELVSSAEPVARSVPEANDSVEKFEIADVEDDVERGLKVGTLPSASCEVKAIQPDATFDAAITTMLLNDYSQLAVMTGSRGLKGAISWKSIARARNANPDASLSAAVIKPDEVSYDTDLVEILPTLLQKEFVFVRGSDARISGIVTVSDVVEAYGDIAAPFFLIGEIDQRLRRLVESTFDMDPIIELCDPVGHRSLTSVDQLTLGDYQRILENPAMWNELGWSLDRKVFAEKLKEITSLRNNVMHFNPDPIPIDSLNTLRHFLGLLREYAV
jgi:CBS domain-containing protein